MWLITENLNIDTKEMQHLNSRSTSVLFLKGSRDWKTRRTEKWSYISLIKAVWWFRFTSLFKYILNSFPVFQTFFQVIVSTAFQKLFERMIYYCFIEKITSFYILLKSSYIYFFTWHELNIWNCNEENARAAVIAPNFNAMLRCFNSTSFWSLPKDLPESPSSETPVCFTEEP